MEVLLIFFYDMIIIIYINFCFNWFIFYFDIGFIIKSEKRIFYFFSKVGVYCWLVIVIVCVIDSFIFV